MEDTLNHLKFLNVLSPRGVHIPNCDKKGFYKKKQVSGVPRMLSSAMFIGLVGNQLHGYLQEPHPVWLSAHLSVTPLLMHVCGTQWLSNWAVHNTNLEDKSKQRSPQHAHVLVFI